MKDARRLIDPITDQESILFLSAHTFCKALQKIIPEIESCIMDKIFVQLYKATQLVVSYREWCKVVHLGLAKNMYRFDPVSGLYKYLFTFESASTYHVFQSITICIRSRCGRKEAMVKDLIIKNRSYRGYDESYKFSREQLMNYVDGARFCASSINIQPLKYFIAYDKEDVDKIQCRIKWARQLPQMTLPHPGMCPTGFVVICQDKNISDNLNRFMKDVGIVAQSMLLMAVEEGLGGCMIGNFAAQDIREGLGLSENLQPLLVVALGKPAETIVLTDVGEDANTAYYRDENDVHYVPKRRLEELLIN